MNQKTLTMVLALLIVSKVSVCADFPGIKDIENLPEFFTECFESGIQFAQLKKDLRDDLYATVKATNQSDDEDELQKKTTKKLDKYLNSKEAFCVTSEKNSFELLLNLKNNKQLTRDYDENNAEEFKKRIKFFDGTHEMYQKVVSLLGILNDDEDKQKKFIADVASKYRMTPYHNICHGFYVGLGAASAYLAQNDYKISNEGLKKLSDDADVADVNQIKIIRTLFFAGFTHDLEHLGLSNDKQKSILQGDRPRITGLLQAVDNGACGLPGELGAAQKKAIAEFVGETNEDVAILELVKLSNLALNIAGKESYKLEDKDEIQKVDLDFLDKIFNIINPDHQKIQNLKKNICSSAEHLQQIAALIVYNKWLAETRLLVDDKAANIISRAILGTTMFLSKNAKFKIHESYEELVHFVDMLNTSPENLDFFGKALEALMIEFLVENRDYSGQAFTVPKWKRDSINEIYKINANELQNQYEAIKEAVRDKKLEDVSKEENVFKAFLKGQEDWKKIVDTEIQNDSNPEANPFKFTNGRVFNQEDVILKMIEALYKAYHKSGFLKEGKTHLIFI